MLILEFSYHRRSDCVCGEEPILVERTEHGMPFNVIAREF